MPPGSARPRSRSPSRLPSPKPSARRPLSIRPTPYLSVPRLSLRALSLRPRPLLRCSCRTSTRSQTSWATRPGRPHTLPVRWLVASSQTAASSTRLRTRLGRGGGRRPLMVTCHRAPSTRCLEASAGFPTSSRSPPFRWRGPAGRRPKRSVSSHPAPSTSRARRLVATKRARVPGAAHARCLGRRAVGRRMRRS